MVEEKKNQNDFTLPRINPQGKVMAQLNQQINSNSNNNNSNSNSNNNNNNNNNSNNHHNKFSQIQANRQKMQSAHHKNTTQQQPLISIHKQTKCNDCNTKVANLQQHQKVCPKRNVKCAKCHQQMPQRLLPTHDCVNKEQDLRTRNKAANNSNNINNIGNNVEQAQNNNQLHSHRNQYDISRNEQVHRSFQQHPYQAQQPQQSILQQVHFYRHPNNRRNHEENQPQEEEDMFTYSFYDQNHEDSLNKGTGYPNQFSINDEQISLSGNISHTVLQNFEYNNSSSVLINQNNNSNNMLDNQLNQQQQQLSQRRGFQHPLQNSHSNNNHNVSNSGSNTNTNIRQLLNTTHRTRTNNAQNNTYQSSQVFLDCDSLVSLNSFYCNRRNNTNRQLCENMPDLNEDTNNEQNEWDDGNDDNEYQEYDQNYHQNIMHSNANRHNYHRAQIYNHAQDMDQSEQTIINQEEFSQYPYEDEDDYYNEEDVDQEEDDENQDGEYYEDYYQGNESEYTLYDQRTVNLRQLRQHHNYYSNDDINLNDSDMIINPNQLEEGDNLNRIINSQLSEINFRIIGSHIAQYGNDPHSPLILSDYPQIPQQILNNLLNYTNLNRLQLLQINPDILYWEEELEEEEEGIPGLEQEEIDKLRITIHKEDSQQNQQDSQSKVSCAICMSDFNVGEELRKLQCNHRFHVDCIDNWLKIKGNCPMCREIQYE